MNVAIQKETHMGQIHRVFVTALLGLGLLAPALASAHEGDWDHDDDRNESHEHDGDRGYDHDGHGYDQGHGGWHGPATLTVRNDFDGEAQVFVDQRLLGVVGGDRSASFQVNAGCHDVRVTRPGTNYVLVQTRMDMNGGTTVQLPIQAPTSNVRLENTGEVALRVQLGSASVWVSPGAAVQVPVRTGNASLVASIRSPQGEWKAIERTFWVEPGQSACQQLHPDPTVVSITNHERVRVRALVDGDDEGYVEPGSTKRVWVRPGSTNVLLLDPVGHVRSNTTVIVGKGKEGRVVLEPRYAQPGGVVMVGGDGRPGGPARPGDGCPYH